ncbi:MAG: secretin N-terminal domain-containing protein [Aliarcobacter sp.]|nr:secretin N-terminal domain-containing protein [Aliarcobacter sp.]
MKFLLLFLLSMCFNLYADDKININFTDLKISDLIKITSKVINKNILFTQEIEGTVDFIPNNSLSKEELVKILDLILEDKGYRLIENNNILRVVKLSEIKKESLSVKLKNIKAIDAKKKLEELSKSIFEETEKQKISIIENLDNNSLLFIGDIRDIEYLSKYIKDIDSETILKKKELKIFSLKNVEASNVIKILEEIVNKKVYLDPNDKALFSLDSESNSIILMGSLDELSYIESLINELDKEKTQVYVQAKIIEVNDDLINQIGVSYGIFGASASNNVLSSFSSSLNKGEVPTLSIDGLKIPDLTSGLALGASLNLLKQNGALDIVSEPSILAINNKESSIYVGETISIKVSSSVTDGGTTKENYEREDVGLTLKVKPRISNDTKVTLEIDTILEGVKTTQTISGNADTSKKQIKTTAILNNGESVIIGGLIENKVESTNQKVPILGDVPLFGELFKNTVNNTKKNNLVIIVTPYLIPKTKDITFVRNKLSELKNLEDRYLANSLLRLKEESLKKKIDAKNREEKIDNLNKELEKYENKKEEILDKKSEHEKRVSEILGY